MDVLSLVSSESKAPQTRPKMKKATKILLSLHLNFPLKMVDYHI